MEMQRALCGGTAEKGRWWRICTGLGALGTEANAPESVRRMPLRGPPSGGHGRPRAWARAGRRQSGAGRSKVSFDRSAHARAARISPRIRLLRLLAIRSPSDGASAASQRPRLIVIAVAVAVAASGFPGHHHGVEYR